MKTPIVRFQLLSPLVNGDAERLLLFRHFGIEPQAVVMRLIHKSQCERFQAGQTCFA